MYLSARVSGTQLVDFSYLGAIIDALPLLLAGRGPDGFVASKAGAT
jgi:hypothetical protein